jgi:hypothetical protein
MQPAGVRRADYVEDLFSGVISAFYNYVSSLVTLLRAPVRGSIRLAVRRMLPRVPQLAPQTIIFVTSVLTELALFSTADMTPYLRSLVIARTTPPEIMPVIVASLVATIVLDVGVRWLARFRYRGDRRRQQRLVTVTLYALAATVAYLATARVATFGAIVTYELPLALILVVQWSVTIALVPAIIVIAAVPRRRERRLSEQIPAFISAAIIVLFLTAAWRLSSSYATHLLSERRQTYLPRLTCSVGSDGRIGALLVATNDSDVARPYYSNDLMITVGIGGRSHELNAGIVASSEGAGLPVYIIPARETFWLEAKTSPAPVIATALAENTRRRGYPPVCRMVLALGEEPFSAYGGFR